MPIPQRATRRDYFFGLDMGHRDRTGWLGMSDKPANPSASYLIGIT